MILDGWGIGSGDPETDAVSAAETPQLDYYLKNYQTSELECSGTAVGLPEGVMGNSEVGHLNIGAGRTVYQDLLRINKSIEDKSFFKNEKLNNLFDNTLKNNGRIHIAGLLSDGCVHSSLKHLDALIKMGVEKKAELVIHPILDGRDAPPQSAEKYVYELENKIKELDNVSIGTLCGRFYAMDRDKRWDRVEKAYNLYTKGQGKKFDDPLEAVKYYYEHKITDEFIEPSLINKSFAPLSDNDGIVFFNFRADRAREITQAFTAEKFDHFQRQRKIKLSGYVCMTTYDAGFGLDVAFPPVKLKNNLGEIVSAQGLSQLRIAETEKYAHVTYFFNGGTEEPLKGEERILVPSPREVETYDLQPEMSADEVRKKFLEVYSKKDFGFCVLNYANMDMVGHTGVFEAAVKACEAVDKNIKSVVDAVIQKNGFVIITADHGNSEKMKDENNTPYTAHTTNRVKLILVDDMENKKLKPKGKLGDIGPTVLKLMGVEIPGEMTGESLV
jgi:2,3-bisphosphoglycerate-independent phosphoglycerate mutase